MNGIIDKFSREKKPNTKQSISVRAEWTNGSTKNGFTFESRTWKLFCRTIDMQLNCTFGIQLKTLSLMNRREVDGF